MQLDLIGDVHGCARELSLLLAELGYRITPGLPGPTVIPPPERRAVFLGDLVNRGPDTPAVLRIVRSMVKSGDALCVAGNHDIMLKRRLQNKEVDDPDALSASLSQLDAEPVSFRHQVVEFISDRPPMYILEGGSLVIAHAGLPAEYQDAKSADAQKFAVFGQSVRDASGQATRYDWARDYQGNAIVVYGHTPQMQPVWRNRTICIDTGCVYGGGLTALSYPAMELVSVPAGAIYYPSPRSGALRSWALSAPSRRVLGRPST